MCPWCLNEHTEGHSCTDYCDTYGCDCSVCDDGCSNCDSSCDPDCECGHEQ